MKPIWPTVRTKRFCQCTRQRRLRKSALCTPKICGLVPNMQISVTNPREAATSCTSIFVFEFLKAEDCPHHWTPPNMANEHFRTLAGPISRPKHAQHVHMSLKVRLCEKMRGGGAACAPWAILAPFCTLLAGKWCIPKLAPILPFSRTLAALA